MKEPEKSLLDLGSYKTFDPEMCISDKSKKLVTDEGSLKTPISISVVIPTKLNISLSSEHQLELKALHKVLSECSKLVDVGYVDEIIVMDASLDQEKKIDYSILKNVTEIAYEELGLFKEQIGILKKFKSENEKAKRGIFPFVFKAVHQFDRNIEQILAQSKVVNFTGELRTLSGKGSGLWLSIPICSGDIITFIDSDMLNFNRNIIMGLTHPIVYSWNEITNEPSIMMVKAYYNRLTISSLADTNNYIVGGRVTRLFVIPLIKLLIKKFNEYEGLDRVKYPLSGEFSASRKLLEKLEFPNNYAIEMSTLFQVLDLLKKNAIANVDLDYFYHIGQSSEVLHVMAYQILKAFQKYVLPNHFDIFNKPNFLDEYEQIARESIKEYEKNIQSLLDYIKNEAQINLNYDVEKDVNNIKEFKKILTTFPQPDMDNKFKTIYLPSWNFLKEKIGNYEFISRMLSRRAVQSTWSRLKELELIN